MGPIFPEKEHWKYLLRSVCDVIQSMEVDPAMVACRCFDSMSFAENEMRCDQANPAALEAAIAVRRVLRNVEANL